MKHTWRRIKISAALIFLAAAGNWLAACRMLWAPVDKAIIQLAAPAWPIEDGILTVDVTEIKPDPDKPIRHFQCALARVDGQTGIQLEFHKKKRRANIHYHAGRLHLADPMRKTHLTAENTGWQHSIRALNDLSRTLSETAGKYRWRLNLLLRPFITGFTYVTGGFCWRIRTPYGHALASRRGHLRRLDFSAPGSDSRWIANFSMQPPTATQLKILAPPDDTPVVVNGGEMDRSLAAICRLAELQLQPMPVIPDEDRVCGAGRLRVRNGNRAMYLAGSPYEIGYQHGKLLAPNIRRTYNRVIYGMGLIHSMEKGGWFLDEARALIKRQRPYIDPAYIEEMRGLAEGAGLPLETAQIGNIFPEFFHCSNAAVFGKATQDGTLLLARVLDYMSWVGLQDEAVTVAVAKTGVNRFVNVSYAGFIGSVTGMNEKQIAIGEMGGGGYGQWDGTPMSFLLRGALEHADTLDEAVAYMSDRRRTCEYYYLIGDGKIPDAVGIAATPESFHVIRAGEAVKRLPDAIPDTVLMSGGKRHRTLVARVRNQYGKIDARTLADIIKRPVAMRSNLHNAIFAPAGLRTFVFNASRWKPACDQAPTIYEWNDLFGN